MIKRILSALKPQPKPSLKEAIAMTRLDTDPKHLLTFAPNNIVKKDHLFPDATVKEVQKKLGLTHNPRVRTIESKASFNQRTSAVSEQLMMGLKPIPKGQLSLFN